MCFISIDTDSLELRDTNSSLQLQQNSIKESTARNIHAFSALELSSIPRGAEECCEQSKDEQQTTGQDGDEDRGKKFSC